MTRYRVPTRSTGRGVYADWLRALKGKSGVYVIRTRRSKKVLYVGESHTGRLYDTITRHFQTWTDQGPALFERKRPGTVYDRDLVEVAVDIMPTPRKSSRKIVDRQFDLIQRLNPRDNVHDGEEEVPF